MAVYSSLMAVKLWRFAMDSYTSPSFQVEFQLPTFYIELMYFVYMGVNPKIGGFYHQNCENNGKPYETWDDLGFFPLFLETTIYIYIYMCVVCVSTLGRLQQNSSKNT